MYSCYTWGNHNWEGSVGLANRDANKNAWLYQICSLLPLLVLPRRICKLVEFILCLSKATYHQRWKDATGVILCRLFSVLHPWGFQSKHWRLSPPHHYVMIRGQDNCKGHVVLLGYLKNIFKPSLWGVIGSAVPHGSFFSGVRVGVEQINVG